MANSVDLQPPFSISTQDPIASAEISLYHGTTALFLKNLVKTRNCGTFMLVDKVLRQRQIGGKTALVLLDILRSIKHSRILITPSADDQPETFVAKSLYIAKNIVTMTESNTSPVYSSALRLMNCLEEYEDNLANVWEEFLIEFYREKLYAVLRSV